MVMVAPASNPKLKPISISTSSACHFFFIFVLGLEVFCQSSQDTLAPSKKQCLSKNLTNQPFRLSFSYLKIISHFKQKVKLNSEIWGNVWITIC